MKLTGTRVVLIALGAAVLSATSGGIGIPVGFRDPYALGLRALVGLSVGAFVGLVLGGVLAVRRWRGGAE